MEQEVILTGDEESADPCYDGAIAAVREFEWADGCVVLAAAAKILLTEKLGIPVTHSPGVKVNVEGSEAVITITWPLPGDWEAATGDLGEYGEKLASLAGAELVKE
jgi:hypothetical protein